MRLISMVVTLFFLAGTGLALGEDLMLEEPPRTSYIGFGLTFLLLTAASGAYATQAKSESETALAAANISYAQYQAAGTDSDAQIYKQQAKNNLAEAQSKEKKANTGYYLALLFAVTSYYSFFPGHLPDNTILVTQNGLIIQHRF